MPALNLSYSSLLGEMNSMLRTKKTLEKDVVNYQQKLYESQSLYVSMLNAQKILSTVADKNTNQVLEFITSMTNKVLSEILPEDPHRVKMTRKLYAGSKPHVLIEVLDPDGNVLDSTTQCGTGLTQIISFMYVICLIEIRKGRRLLILDERLNGLHKTAKSIISRIIEIFVKGGFQFIFVEYSLNDIGKIYNVEKRGTESRIVPVDGEYDDTCIFVDDVDLSVLDENYTEDENVEE